MPEQDPLGDLTASPSSGVRAFGRTTSKYRFGQTNALGPRITAATQEIQIALANNKASVNEEQQAQLRQKMREQAEAKQHVVTAAEARKLEVQKEHQKLYEKLTINVQEELRELYDQEVKAEAWSKADDVKREMRQQLAKDLTNEVKEELRQRLRADIQKELPSRYAEEIAEYRRLVKERVEKDYPPLLKAELKAKLEPEIIEALRTKLEPEIAEELRSTLKPGIIEAVKIEVRAELYDAEALREGLKPSLPEVDVKDESPFVSEPDLSDSEGGNALERQENVEEKKRRLEGERYTTWPPMEEEFDHESFSYAHAGTKRFRHTNIQHDGHYFDRDEARFNGQYESNFDDEEGSTGARPNSGAYHGMKRSRLASHGPSNGGRDIQGAREDNGGATTHVLGESRLKPVNDSTHGAFERTGHELDSENDDSDNYGMSISLSKRINQQFLAGAFADDSDAPDDDNLVKDEVLSTNDEQALPEDHWEDLGDDSQQADELSDDSEEGYGENVNIGIKETSYPSQVDDPSDMSEEGYYETGEAEFNIGIKSSEVYPPSADDSSGDDSSGASEQEYDSNDESEEEQEYDVYDESENENVGTKASETFHTSQIGDLRGLSKDNAIDLGDSDSDEETRLPPNTQTMGFSPHNLGLSYGYSSSDEAQSHDSHDVDRDATNVNVVQDALNDLPDSNSNPAVIQKGSLKHGENLALAKAACVFAEQAQENGDDDGYDDEETLVEDVVATVVKTIKHDEGNVVEDINVAVVKTIEQEEL
jgi:hypothetical protein